MIYADGTQQAYATIKEACNENGLSPTSLHSVLSRGYPSVFCPNLHLKEFRVGSRIIKVRHWLEKSGPKTKPAAQPYKAFLPKKKTKHLFDINQALEDINRMQAEIDARNARRESGGRHEERQ